MHDSPELDGQGTQVDLVVMPVVVEYVPVTQSVHVKLPDMSLYLPATQAVHGPSLGPV